MKYRSFIEENFLIDEPKTGQLVPFIFNKVQIKWYGELCDEGLEDKGVAAPLREIIVKARREGFSSLVLALFAADDILQKNPTESQVVSYKDDATSIFRKRYRRFCLSYWAMKDGNTPEDIQENANILEQYARTAFSTDSTNLVHRHNKANFFCGSASARTGGRGGVLQKLLFSEAAHYPDTENMTAAEIIEGTSQQVDKEAGWIFQESTGNGTGNLFYKTVQLAKDLLSRYKLRFYGWKEFYTPDQFKVIESEFTDPDMLKQEYPENLEEAFLAAHLTFTSKTELDALVGIQAFKDLVMHLEIGGVNYIDQCETILDFITTYERTNPNRGIYIGIDSAKDIDRTVVTFIKQRELITSGGVKVIAIDATGAGDFVPDWFEKNSKYYIHRVKFSRPTKSVMYKNLRVVIQKKLTSLPPFMLSAREYASAEWKNWYIQMLGIQKEIIGDMLVVAHPPGKCSGSNHDYNNCPHHDDYPDSWALAEIGYIVINGLPAGQTPPEEKGNFNRSVRNLLSDQSGKGSIKAAEDYL